MFKMKAYDIWHRDLFTSLFSAYRFLLAISIKLPSRIKMKLTQAHPLSQELKGLLKGALKAF